MKENEGVLILLKKYYKYIFDYLGSTIDKRLNMHNLENSALISRVLKVSKTLPTYALYDDSIFTESSYIDDDEFYACRYREEEYSEEGESFKGDPSLDSLDRTLFYGKKHCIGFENIFKNVSLTNYKDLDYQISDILSKVKCFEFLSKREFRDISVINQSVNQSEVYFIARMPPSTNYFAILVTRFLDTYDIENTTRCDEHYVRSFISSNIYNAISSKYPSIEHFCKSNIGINKGIIFLSNNYDYFGNYKYGDTLFNLSPVKVKALLNKEWSTHISKHNTNNYLHNLVVMIGRNVWDAIIYPSLIKEQS